MFTGHKMITNAKYFLSPLFIILFTFSAFIIFMIDELAKLYFDKVKCIQELTHLDNSKKDINLDKIL